MTIKESESEMLEIFNHKLALTKKINYNSKQVVIFEREVERLRKKLAEWKAALANQIKERQKLAFVKVARETGIDKDYLCRKYVRFLGGSF